MRFACSIIIERRFCSSSSCLYRVGKLLAIPSDFVFIYFDNNGNNIGVKRKKKSKSLSAPLFISDEYHLPPPLCSALPSLIPRFLSVRRERRLKLLMAPAAAKKEKGKNSSHHSGQSNTPVWVLYAKVRIMMARHGQRWPFVTRPFNFLPQLPFFIFDVGSVSEESEGDLVWIDSESKRDDRRAGIIPLAVSSFSCWLSLFLWGGKCQMTSTTLNDDQIGLDISSRLICDALATPD